MVKFRLKTEGAAHEDWRGVSFQTPIWNPGNLRMLLTVLVIQTTEPLVLSDSPQRIVSKDGICGSMLRYIFACERKHSAFDGCGWIGIGRKVSRYIPIRMIEIAGSSCAASAAGYRSNDLGDIAQYMLHPKKVFTHT